MKPLLALVALMMLGGCAQRAEQLRMYNTCRQQCSPYDSELWFQPQNSAYTLWRALCACADGRQKEVF